MKIAALLGLSALSLLAGCTTINVYDTATLPACTGNIRLSTRPRAIGHGTIVRFLSRSRAMAILSKTEASVGLPIDGAYLDNTRAVIEAANGARYTILIPYGMKVAVGDRVAFQGGYLNGPPLCNYVPNLVTRKLQPMPGAGFQSPE